MDYREYLKKLCDMHNPATDVPPPYKQYIHGLMKPSGKVQKGVFGTHPVLGLTKFSLN